MLFFLTDSDIILFGHSPLLLQNHAFLQLNITTGTLPDNRTI